MDCTCGIRSKDESKKKPNLFYCSARKCRVGALKPEEIVQRALVAQRSYVFCSEVCYLRWLKQPLFCSVTSLGY